MDQQVEKDLLEGLNQKTQYYRELPRPLDKSAYNTLFENSKKSRWQGPSSLTVVHLDGYKLAKTVSEFRDDRVIRNENLINQTIQYAKENNLPIPATSLHIWVSDRQPWMLGGVDKKVPIYVFAAPKNSKFILFPDNSFDCLETSAKYSGSGMNWDQIKQKFLENPIIDKKDIIYFKGTPTTFKHSRLREQLYLIAKNGTYCTGKESLFKPAEERKTNNANTALSKDLIKNPKPNEHVLIDLDAWNTYIPVWEFAKYKYLLNLPGHYPWSNRMKYLFLTKSLVINVSVTTIGSDYVDEPFETIIDYIFKPNVDYLDKHTTYFVPKHRHSLDTPIEQITENNIVFNYITSVRDTPRDLYDKITESAYTKASTLNMTHIYKYIYNLILFNAEIF